MRTYSRLGKSRSFEDEPPLKRRRVSRSPAPEQTSDSIDSPPKGRTPCDQSSSSPAPIRNVCPTVATLSSDAPAQSTPPSSPPPSQCVPASRSLRTIDDETKKQEGVRPADNVGRPLYALSMSSLNARKQPASRPKKSRRFTQLHIDIGQKLRKECKTCGMEYTLSNKEDVGLHAKYHNMNIDGIGLGKAFLESDIAQARKVWDGGAGKFIMECQRKDRSILRGRVQKVLEVADLELGAVRIAEEVLWSAKTDAKGSPRFKAYAYVIGNNCVGLCLVETLDSGYRTLAGQEGDESRAAVVADTKPLRVSVKEYPMLMGVTRVWTSNNYRHKGIATRLLDTACDNFLYGVKIPKEEIAFSQPTEQGAALARSWFGADAGWHVYSDS